MATLTENTVVVHPETGQPVLLAATGELPGWASGLVGEHLLSDGPAPAREGDELARLRARIAELEEAQAGSGPEKPAPAADTGLAPDQYDGASAEKLRAELERRDLPKSGARPELIARLRTDDTAQQAAPSQ